MTSTTGIKYLNVDKGYKYVVRVYIKRKSFVVWHGRSLEVGTKIANKVQQVINDNKMSFMEWYDYQMEGWLESHGYKNED